MAPEVTDLRRVRVHVAAKLAPAASPLHSARRRRGSSLRVSQRRSTAWSAGFASLVLAARPAPGEAGSDDDGAAAVAVARSATISRTLSNDRVANNTTPPR